MITVEIKNKFRGLLSLQVIEKTISEVLIFIGMDINSDLSVLIDSDTTLRKLNSQYRGYDQPTDVLSFESDEINPETGNRVLGDIAISYPIAEKQAIEADHPVENEIILLLIHGILHLSGYNHETREEKEIMWDKQQSILDHLGVKINRISGDENFHD